MTNTNGNNTVVGALTESADTTTFNPGDSINGTVGNTTLSISSSGTAGTNSGFTLTGVKTFQLSNNATGTESFDLTSTTGLTGISVVNSGTGVSAFTNVKNIVGSSINNTQGNLNIDYVDSVVTGTADAMAVTLNGAGTTSSMRFDVDGIETLNVTSTGSASGSSTNGTRVTLDSTALKSMTVAGSAGARITADFAATASGADSTRVATVDASSATGAIDVLLTVDGSAAGLGQFVSVTGGTGNDTVQINALSTNATISGGLGTDTLAVRTLAGGSNDFKNISGFESIRFNDAVSTAVNLTNAGTISNVIFNNTVNSTVSGLTSGVSAQLNTQAANTGNTLTLNVVGASAGDNDQATIILGSSTSAIDPATTLNRGTVQVENVETINLQSLARTAVLDSSNAIALQDTGIKTLNVTGNQSAAVTIAAGSNSLTAINASAFTGNFDMRTIADAALSDVSATVTGGTGNDSLKGGTGNDSLLGGAGNDLITAGEGNDTVDAGAGVDTIEAGIGNDLLQGGTGNDIFRFNVTETLTKNDTVIGGDGTDSIQIGGGAVLADSAFTNVSAVETVTVQATGQALELTLGSNFAASGVANINQFTASGQPASGVGNTKVTASSTFTNAVTINSAAGTDTISFAGTTGSFLYTNAASNVTSADTITGGSGVNDAITLRADGGVGADFTNVSAIETVTIAASSTAPASTASLTVGANTVTNANVLTVNAAALVDAGANFTFNASAVTVATDIAGRFLVTGGNANDNITGGSGNDTVTSGLGNDTVTVGSGADSVDAGSGNDLIYGGAGNDTIHGGSGNDQLAGEGGVDRLRGDSGDDLYIWNTVSQSVQADGSSLTADTVVGFDAGDGTTVTDTIRLPSGFANINTITNVTIGSVNLTSFETTLGANGTLTTALNAAGKVAVLTISSGTAAGTYLVANNGVGGGVYNDSTTVIVRLEDAVNLANLAPANFVSTADTVFTTQAATTVNGATGAITGSTAFTTASQAVLSGYTSINSAAADKGLTVNMGGTADQTFVRASGAVTGAADSSINQLAYTSSGAGTLALNFGSGSNTYTTTSLVDGVSVTGGTGVDTLVWNGAAATIDLTATTGTANIAAFENINASGATGAVTATLVAGSTSYVSSAAADKVTLVDLTGNALAVNAAATATTAELSLINGGAGDTVTVSNLVGDLDADDAGNDTNDLVSTLVVNLLDNTVDSTIAIKTGSNTTTINNGATGDTVTVTATRLADGKLLTVGGASAYTVTGLIGDITSTSTGAVGATLASVATLTATNNGTGLMTITNGAFADNQALTTAGTGSVTVNGFLGNLTNTAAGTVSVTLADNTDGTFSVTSSTAISVANGTAQDGDTITIAGAGAFTMTGLVADVTSTATGASNLTLADVLTLTATNTSGGTMTINAAAMTDGDVLTLGAGTGAYIVNNVSDSDVGTEASASTGGATITATTANSVTQNLWGTAGNDNITATGSDGAGTTVVNIVTGNGTNTATVIGAYDTITVTGGTGIDTINLGGVTAGAALIIGGLGADIITAGAGVDTIRFTSGLTVDTINQFAQGSVDILQLDVSDMLSSLSVVMVSGNDDAVDPDAAVTVQNIAAAATVADGTELLQVSGTFTEAQLETALAGGSRALTIGATAIEANDAMMVVWSDGVNLNYGIARFTATVTGAVAAGGIDVVALGTLVGLTGVSLTAANLDLIA